MGKSHTVEFNHALFFAMAFFLDFAYPKVNGGLGNPQKPEMLHGLSSLKLTLLARWQNGSWKTSLLGQLIL